MDKNERNSRREILKKRRNKNQKKEQTIFLAVLLLLVLVIAGTLIYSSLQGSKEVITAITPSYRAESNGFSTGDPNAPVKVQEFADFQCPGCQYFALSLEPMIQSKYIDTGQVYFTYTPFSFLGQESTAAAEAAYCADDQGKFWEYHDILFTNQGAENSGQFTTARLKAFADSLGLDMGQFNNCFTSEKYSQAVIDDYNLAVSTNITSTPSFLVNGVLVNMAGLETAITDALAGIATTTP